MPALWRLGVPDKGIHPMFMLLVLNLIGRPVDELCAGSLRAIGHTKRGSIGEEQLSSPCANVACPLSAADPYEVLRHHTMVRGRIRVGCPECGFRYSWSSDQPMQIVVSRTGALWDEELARALTSGQPISLRELGRRLNVAPRTVKRHARRLNLWRPEWADSRRFQLRRQERTENLRLQYQMTWIATRRAHPDASRTTLGHLALNAQRFLSRHEPAWLSANSPAPVRRSRGQAHAP
jgi:hypothetical protein